MSSPQNQSADQCLSLKRKRSEDEESLYSEVSSQEYSEESLEYLSQFIVEVLGVDSNSSRSGVIVGSRRVVANAHSVEKTTHEVKLKKPDSDGEYVARVLAIGTDCDLALLTVDDDEFWKGVSPVEFGTLPGLGDYLTLVGYPKGEGANQPISATSVMASSIAMRSYAQGYAELLCLKINGMVDLQNRSGATFNYEDQCVGISLHLLKDEYSERNAYLVPSSVVLHFINDYEKSKKYTGFPAFEFEWQNMLNPWMRKALGMDSREGGIRVTRVDPTLPASLYLKPSDIILEFDDVRIRSNGTVLSPRGGQISLSYLVTQKYIGDTVAVKVLRDSEVHTFHIKLRSHKRQWFPQSYYVVGGLLFTSVYKLCAYSKDSDELLVSRPNFNPFHQVVVIYQVLEAKFNNGYKNITNFRVLKVNDKPIKDLKGLVNLVDTCIEKLLKIDLENNKTIIFNTETAKGATLDILAKHNIPSALSDDLKS